MFINNKGHHKKHKANYHYNNSSSLDSFRKSSILPTIKNAQQNNKLKAQGNTLNSSENCEVFMNGEQCQETSVDIRPSTKSGVHHPLHIMLYTFPLLSLIKPATTSPIDVQCLNANSLAIGDNLQANNHNMALEIYPYTQIQGSETAHSLKRNARNIQPKFKLQTIPSYKKKTFVNDHSLNKSFKNNLGNADQDNILLLSYLQQGMILYNMDDNIAALASVNKAIKLNSKYAKAHYQKSLILYAMHEDQKALTSVNTAIELNSKYAKAYYHKSIILDDMGGRDKDTLDAINKAINLNPKYYEAYYHKSIILYNMGGKSKEALNAINKAIRINSKHADAHNYKKYYLIRN